MVKNRITLIFLYGVLSFIVPLIVSCSSQNPSDKIKQKEVSPQDKVEPQRLMAEDAKKNVQTETEENLISGATVELPWAIDENFKQAQEQNNVKELMAAYRTVLRDPLPGEEENVHLAARYLSGSIISPGEIFSQNHKIGPYIESRGFKIGPTYSGANLVTTIGGGVCKVASTLYNVVVLSNLQVVERHNHSMPVPYVPYGQDATVYYGYSDFRFKNNTDSPVLVWAQGIENILYIGFYSRKKAPKVEWHHETLSTVKAPVVYRENRELAAESEKKVAEGMDGATVRSWVIIENPDGTKSEKQLGKSYYKPFPNIIEKGIKAK